MRKVYSVICKAVDQNLDFFPQISESADIHTSILGTYEADTGDQACDIAARDIGFSSGVNLCDSFRALDWNCDCYECENLKEQARPLLGKEEPDRWAEFYLEAIEQCPSIDPGRASWK